MDDLTKHEIETLEMLAGRREEKRGAVVAMCLDYLRRQGYCTPGPNYAITSAGLAALAEWDAGGKADAA
jgi:aerobic-type carbon monoxide dehydrogenase small subunit (CoxS/CutS family)